MFDTLFGADVPLAVKFFLAFVIVLGLIGGTAWAVRRFGGDRLGGSAGRGRQPRLAVIDAATVDSRRRLVLIRRDNVEHLLMIGGPTDVVVEPNIVRAAGAPREAYGAAPSRAAADTLPRPVPLAEGSMWPLQPEPAPMPRPPRPAPVEEPAHWPVPTPPEQARQQQRPLEPRSANTLAGLANELAGQPQPTREIPPPPRAEPPRVPTAPSETAVPSPQEEQNLAQMAHRLEAALRRPGQPAPARTGSAAKPAAKAIRPAPAAQPAPPPEPPAEAPPPQPRTAKEQEPAQTASAEAKPATEEETKSGKTLYESLEQEMASLLGRPQDKQDKG